MTRDPTPAALEPSGSQHLGSALATRPLHVIWLLDRSGSMSADGKIQALNNAMEESIPALRSAAQSAVNAEVLVRAVSFGSGAEWHSRRRSGTWRGATSLPRVSPTWARP